MTKKIINIDLEFESLQDGFFNEASINRRTANQLKANDPTYIAKFQGENNPNFGNRGELNPLFGKSGNTFLHTQETKNKLSISHSGTKNHMYGKKHTDESIKKMKDAQKGEKSVWYGKKHTEDTKVKQSLSAKGKSKTEEHKQNISNSKKGKPAHNKGIPRILVKCPHCNKEGGEGIMKRWHFDNCKHKD